MKVRGDRNACAMQTWSCERRLRRRCAVRGNDYLVDRRIEFIQAGAGHDNRIAAAMRFFRDAQKTAPLILAELDKKMLSFDMQFSARDDVVH